MGISRSKGEQTRQRIIAEAAGLFNSRGYEGSSMQDVMQATGLEKGGLYRHFASKEELAAEAFRYAWGSVAELRSRELDNIDSNLDKLRQVIANFVEIRSSVPGGCPLMNTAIETDDGNPVLRDLARKALKAWREKLASIIRDGINAGEIKTAVDVNALANVIISTLEGALMISRLERRDDALHHAQHYLQGHLATVESRSKKQRSGK